MQYFGGRSKAPKTLVKTTVMDAVISPTSVEGDTNTAMESLNTIVVQKLTTTK